ncbi:MAG TPA: nucleotidyltransferase family protein [Chitinophaga sp.]|nr:nucleotidyltransferase family protein [Chitinophaga sp.]
MENVGILILGAGNSSRLGQPKQLLEFQGKPLICRMVDEASGTASGPVMIVAGASAVEVKCKLQGTPALIVMNDNWVEGMGSSIATGIKALMEQFPDLEGVIIMVCDQPYVTSVLLRQLIEQHIITRKGIIASTYDNTAGTPVLFHNRYFRALSGLTGQQGAKKILQQSTDDLALVPFPLGVLDIDTAEDYQRLLTGELSQTDR